MQQYAVWFISLQSHSTCFGCRVYRRLRLQFLVLPMMGAGTPETCRVTLQWNKSDCILLHLVGLLFNVTDRFSRNVSKELPVYAACVHVILGAEFNRCLTWKSLVVQQHSDCSLAFPWFFFMYCNVTKAHHYYFISVKMAFILLLVGHYLQIIQF